MTIQTEVLSELGQAAIGYAQMGWHVFPLQPDGKLPLISKRMGGNGQKDATTDQDQIRNWWTVTPNANIGVFLAKSGLVAIDPDIYKADCQWSEFIAGRELPDTLVQKTPSGGMHYIFSADRDAQFAGHVCNQVDIKHHGYIVLEPSTFNGSQYQFQTDDEPAPVPSWVPRKGAASQLVPQVRRSNTDRTIDLMAGFGVHDNSRDLIASLIAKGTPADTAGDIARAAIISGTEPGTRRDERLARVDYHVQTAIEKFAPVSFDGKSNAPSQAGGWEDQLIRNAKGRVYSNLGNVALILENSEAFEDCFAYDEFTRRKLLTSPLPGSNAPRANFKGREWRDADYGTVCQWFHRNGLPAVSTSTVIGAVDLTFANATTNALQSHLQRLPEWDGTKRINSWLFTYCGVDPEDHVSAAYIEEVASKWLISAIARAMRPGCKADCVLILEGKQGARKSTALRVLAGADWFGDSLPPMGGKDASAYVSGKWIIELAELASMTKSETEEVKAFISRQEERYRPAYGRNEVSYPRQCVFAGTTNRSDFLQDTTGNRRFWPVRVSDRIDTDGLAKNRDQLWAEAKARFEAGEQWWLSDAAEVVQKSEAAERMNEDPWTSSIAAFVSGRTETSIPEVLRDCLAVEQHRATRADSNRVASALRGLGFVAGKNIKSGDFRDARGYRRDAPF